MRALSILEMRIYQLVRGLAARHDVTCLSFAPDVAAEQALAPLQRVCRVVTVRGPIARSLPRLLGYQLIVLARPKGGALGAADA